MSDAQSRDGVVELAVLSALQTLALVDDEAVPPANAAEDAAVARYGFVSREDDMRLQRAGRVEELVILDDLARVGIALHAITTESAERKVRRGTALTL